MNYIMYAIMPFCMVGIIAAEKSLLPSLSWSVFDGVMTISVDTYKDVNSDSVSIVHEQDRVVIDFLDLNSTSCSITLHSFNNSLSLALCAEHKASSSDEKNNKNVHARYNYSSYGASCRKEVIPYAVNFELLTAEYEGTVLLLHVPLVPKVTGRKISINPAKKASLPKESKKNKKRYKPIEELKVDEK